jgi:hypothetical protein
MTTENLIIEVSNFEAAKASIIIKDSDLQNRFVCLVKRITANMWCVSFADFSDKYVDERESLWNAIEFQLLTGGVNEFKIY